MALASALVGLGVSTYLTVAHYVEPTSLSCPDTGVVNCTKVTTSAASMLFGFFPVALAGALFFLAMSVLTLPAVWRRTGAWWRRTRLAGAAAGVAMVAYLVYAEVWQVRAICLWCTVAHVVAFILFVAVLTATLIEPLDPECPESPLRPEHLRADT